MAGGHPPFLRDLEGVDEELIAFALMKLSELINADPEISELDINPLMGTKDKLVAVDARISLKP